MVRPPFREHFHHWLRFCVRPQIAISALLMILQLHLWQGWVKVQGESSSLISWYRSAILSFFSAKIRYYLLADRKAYRKFSQMLLQSGQGGWKIICTLALCRRKHNSSCSSTLSCMMGSHNIWVLYPSGISFDHLFVVFAGLSCVCIPYHISAWCICLMSDIYLLCLQWEGAKNGRALLLFWDRNCQNKKPLQFNFLLSIFFQNFLCLRNNTVSPDCLIQQKTLSLWAGLMLFFPPIVSIRGNFPRGRKFRGRLAPSGTRRGVTFVIRGERVCRR